MAGWRDRAGRCERVERHERVGRRDRAAHAGAPHGATGATNPYMAVTMKPIPTQRLLPLALLPLLAMPLAACSGDDDVDARREAAREQVRERRVSVTPRDPGATVRDTALSGAYARAVPAGVEEVAAAIEAIPVEARRIRIAKAIDALELRLAPEPIVVGPRARGDLQIDNTAPLETIRNAVEGSALAYTQVRRRGVVIADVVAARLDGADLTVYVATE